MTLTKEATKKMAQIPAPRPTNTQKQYTSPEVQRLDELARDRAWVLYHWTRLLLAYGDQYRSDCERLIREIQGLQDQATEIEKSLAEEEAERNPELEGDLTAHMGPA